MPRPGPPQTRHAAPALCRALCGAALGLAAQASAGPLSHRVVVLTGTDGPLGPRLGTGVSYFLLSATPVIDDAGRVIFPGFLQGTGITLDNEAGLWGELGSPGQLALLARQGDQAPGAAPGQTFGITFFEPTLARSGRACFRAELTGPGIGPGNDRAAFAIDLRAGGDPLTLLGREGDALAPPSDPGYTIVELATQTASGGPAGAGYSATLAAPPTVIVPQSAAWLEPHDGSGPMGAPPVMVRTGDPAPAGPDLPDSTFAVIGASAGPVGAFSVNPSGTAAFAATIDGPYVTGQSDSGIWRRSPNGTLTAVVQEGNPVPGTIPGLATVFDTFGNPLLAASGDLLFPCVLRGPAVGTVSDGALIRARPEGTLELVAREGDQAPNAPEGVVFSFFSAALINARAEVVIYAVLTGPGVTAVNDAMLVLWRPASLAGGGVATLTAIAREGEQAAGLPAGVRYSSFPFVPAVNGQGRLAFKALLTGTGVSFLNDDVLFVTQPDGTTAPLHREGTLFTIAPGLTRTIRSTVLVQESGGGDGRRVALNEQGRLAYTLRFSDSSAAVVVTDLGPLPGEPPMCPADLDGSGTVDADDIFAFLDMWFVGIGQPGGQCPPAPAPPCPGDADDSGLVTADDIFVFISRWFEAVGPCP